MTLRPFTAELRRQGFEFCWRSRGGGCEVTQFAKTEGARELHVQLWRDGKHRVSHGIIGEHGLHETTPPTDFSTVEEMIAAIRLEWRRPSVQPKA